jgi:hypothetical protein
VKHPQQKEAVLGSRGMMDPGSRSSWPTSAGAVHLDSSSMSARWHVSISDTHFLKWSSLTPYSGLILNLPNYIQLLTRPANRPNLKTHPAIGKTTTGWVAHTCGVCLRSWGAWTYSHASNQSAAWCAVGSKKRVSIVWRRSTEGVKQPSLG